MDISIVLKTFIDMHLNAESKMRSYFCLLLVCWFAGLHKMCEIWVYSVLLITYICHLQSHIVITLITLHSYILGALHQLPKLCACSVSDPRVDILLSILFSPRGRQTSSSQWSLPSPETDCVVYYCNIIILYYYIITLLHALLLDYTCLCIFETIK